MQPIFSVQSGVLTHLLRWCSSPSLRIRVSGELIALVYICINNAMHAKAFAN